MSSKATQIIAPDVNNPDRDAEVYVDGATNALLVKVVNPGSGGGPTADVNLASYGGTAVGAANAVHVQPGTGAVWAAIQSGSWTVAVSNFPSVYPVNDNGGSLTVDGTVAATQSGAWSVTAEQATHANLNAQVRLQDRDSASMLSVLVADAAAVFPMTETGTLPLFLVTDSPEASSAGIFTYPRLSEAGGVYVTLLNPFTVLESSTHASGDQGLQALAVRRDAGTALALDGQYHPLMVNSTGRLFVDVGTPSVSVSAVVPGVGATNLGKAEDAAHTTGDAGVMALAVRVDTESSSVSADGDYAPIQVNASGRLKVNTLLESGDGSGDLLEVYEATAGVVTRSHGIAPMCEVTDAPSVGGIGVWSHPFIDSNTGGLIVHAVNLPTVNLDSSRAEDSAHASGHVGQFVLAVRRDTLTSFSGTDGDYSPFAVTSLGALWVKEAGVVTLALSGSTRGRPIQITGTNSAGANTLHTATTTSGQVDRLFVYLTNTSTSAVVVTIEFGTTGTANELKVVVPANATIEAVAGAVIGGGSTDTIKAYAATGSVVNAFGRVERLS